MAAGVCLPVVSLAGAALGPAGGRIWRAVFRSEDEEPSEVLLQNFSALSESYLAV